MSLLKHALLALIASCTACTPEPSHLMPTDLYCAQSAIACCDDDLTCEEQWFVACCTALDCGGVISTDELDEQLMECAE